MATRYWLGGPGIEPRKGQNFFLIRQTGLEALNGYRVIPGVRAAEELH